VEFRKIDSVKT